MKTISRLDDQVLDFVIKHLYENFDGYKGYGHPPRLSAVCLCFRSKIRRISQRYRELIVVCEKKRKEEDNSSSKSIDLDETQCSDDLEYELSRWKIFLNGYRYKSLADVADAITFILNCGATVGKVDMSRFLATEIPYGFNELVKALKRLHEIKELSFSETFDTAPYEQLGFLVKNNTVCINKISNITVNAFCQLNRQCKLEYMQMHAKILQKSMSALIEGNVEDCFIFEATDKLKNLLKSGIQCSNLSILAFNDSRRHILLSELINDFNVQHISFMPAQPSIFTEDLKWFLDWEMSSFRFNKINSVSINIASNLGEEQVLQYISHLFRAIPLVFPFSQYFCLKFTSIVDVQTVTEAAKICEQLPRSSISTTRIFFSIKKKFENETAILYRAGVIDRGDLNESLYKCLRKGSNRVDLIVAVI